MKQFTARAYNNFHVNDRGNIVKSSSTERLKDEIDYYKIIKRADLGDYFPEIYSYIEESPYSIEMEYLDTVEISPESLVEQLLVWFDRASEVRVLGSSEARRAMYVDKTINYYDELASFPYFTGLCQYDTVVVNGQKLRNFHVIWPDIQDLIYRLLVNDDDFTVIHGDLCLANILTTEDGLKLIDPRGSFGKKGIWGDPLYDLAKFRHSYHGRYESIIHDRFDVCHSCRRIDFVFDEVGIDRNVGINFDDISIFSSTSVKLIEGLIFIGMCSRHYDSLNRQKVMYATGVQILNEILL